MNNRPLEAAVLRRQSHPTITNVPICLQLGMVGDICYTRQQLCTCAPSIWKAPYNPPWAGICCEELYNTVGGDGMAEMPLNWAAVGCEQTKAHKHQEGSGLAIKKQNISTRLVMIICKEQLIYLWLHTQMSFNMMQEHIFQAGCKVTITAGTEQCWQNTICWVIFH
jgi:hypothetical protein